MIKQLRITNFKVVQDSDLLSLPALTAIIGRNGSGKSSLIEALDWLGTAAYAGAQAATAPFQRARDLINEWSDQMPERTFGIRLVFEPDDISAGERLVYQLEVGADPSGEIAQLRTEQLSVLLRDKEELLIRTDEATGTRQFRQDSLALEDELRSALPPGLFNDVQRSLRGRERELGDDESSRGASPAIPTAWRCLT